MCQRTCMDFPGELGGSSGQPTAVTPSMTWQIQEGMWLENPALAYHNRIKSLSPAQSSLLTPSFTKLFCAVPPAHTVMKTKLLDALITPQSTF